MSEAKRTFMEQMDEMLPDVLVHTMTFDHREDVVEITYAELNDQADGVGLIKTIAMEREMFVTEIAEIESDLRDLIGEANVAIRNPDAHRDRMDRAIARARTTEDEDDDDD